MNKWLVASYIKKELKRLELNLTNQNFKYYLPKIIIQKNKSIFKKDEVLFPGYIFIHIDPTKYSALNYTKGVKNIIKFGNNISFISDDEIENIKVFEKIHQNLPVKKNIQIGQDVKIKEGGLKGNLAKIYSLPAKERIDILVYILGSKRRINIALKDLAL